jgi:hypothetical protein
MAYAKYPGTPVAATAIYLICLSNSLYADRYRFARDLQNRQARVREAAKRQTQQAGTRLSAIHNENQSH